MGSELLDPIKKVSDVQYLANMADLENVLFVAADTTYSYEEFTITDLINNEYFNVKSISDVVATSGEVFLRSDEDGTPLVTWTIDNALRAGKTETLTINLTLKEEYETADSGLYPTNKGEYIRSKLTDIPDEDIFSENTPLLKRDYTVHYDANAPRDCTVSGLPQDETHPAFDNVEINSAIPMCSGYSFRGFEIVTDNVDRYNDDFFVMPESDVIIKAVWEKVAISKKMYGSVYTAPTMQSFSCSSLSDGKTTRLVDERENGVNSYIVGKAADGNCWMLQNLKLGSSLRSGNSITVDVTNNSSGEIAGTFNLTGTSALNPFVIPRIKNTPYDDNVPRIVCRNDYGCYYNYPAATAGTGISASAGTDATSSICPTGWSLPSKSQLWGLADAYGRTVSNIVNATDTYNTTGAVPGLTRGGSYKAGASDGPENAGAYSLYWTRTIFVNVGIYVGPKRASVLLVNDSSLVENSQWSIDGLPIRCVSVW